eukprot:12924660-Alexandrium_andersonii.AAC.1
MASLKSSAPPGSSAQCRRMARTLKRNTWRAGSVTPLHAASTKVGFLPLLSPVRTVAMEDCRARIAFTLTGVTSAAYVAIGMTLEITN